MNTTHPPGDAPAKQLPVSSSSQANPGRTTINRAACRRKSPASPTRRGSPASLASRDNRGNRGNRRSPATAQPGPARRPGDPDRPDVNALH